GSSRRGPTVQFRVPLCGIEGWLSGQNDHVYIEMGKVQVTWVLSHWWQRLSDRTMQCCHRMKPNSVLLRERNGRSRFRYRLLEWYRRNRRDLPWRRDREPYRVWLSEIMLQQTRVTAVVEYYRQFLRRFPNVTKLAAA